MSRIENSHITMQSNLQNSHIDITKPIQQIKRYKSYFELILIDATYALGNFYFGYSIVYLNSLQFSLITQKYNITIDKQLAQGLLVGAIPIGAGIGALISNVLLNIFSRKQSILIVNLIAFIVGFLIFVQNFAMFFIMRIIQGICVGAYSTFVPIMIKQITPVEQSGKLGIMPQFFICFGVVFAFLFKLVLSKITGDSTGQFIWIYVFGFTLLTITLQSILIIFIYKFETPKYLIGKQKFQQTKQLLAIIYKEQFIQEVFKQKLKDANKSNDVKNSGQSHQILEVKLNQASKNEQKQIKQDKSTPNKAIFLALHLGLLQQFTGINAVVVYGGQTVGEVYSNLKQVFPIIINLIQTIAPLVLSPLLACVGRKKLIQVGSFFNIFTTILVGTGFIVIIQNFNAGAGMIMTGLLTFMINFAFTIGPLVWMYVPQIAQPNIVTLATAMNWLGATLVMFLFPILKGKVLNNNPAILFYFFSLWCFVSLFINQKFIVQTKDKTQKQIRQEFMNEKENQNKKLEYQQSSMIVKV